jgi:hypothetical protein
MAITSGGGLLNGGVSFPASSCPESSSTEHVTMEGLRSRRRAATTLNPKKKGTPKSAVLAALSDTNSELAQFLFVKGGKEKGDASAFFQSSVGKSVRRLGSSLMNGSSRGNGLEHSGEEEPESMESINAFYYSLALAPMENRSARIIMLGEMFAVFGALFLAGTWIIWEWGSHKTYGGEGTNEIYNRVFNAIMASAITCNIMLALFGSFVWLNSILYGANEEDFVFEARHLLAFCNTLLYWTAHLVICGLFLGVWSNLSPYYPEATIVITLGVVIFLIGTRRKNQLNWAILPLEFFHSPLLGRLISFPRSVLTQKGRDKLSSRANVRAKKLKTRAYRERKLLDPEFDKALTTNVGSLLCDAAAEMGRLEDDVTEYEARLKDDWIDEIDKLRGRSVDFLSKYMPFGLAEKVHEILLSEESSPV